ncbi:MAG: ATP-binding protein [Bryobacterales bacterium]|nr:ATP-binding protein [Bryobacterales bacterium]
MTVFVGPNNSGKTLVLREISSSLGDERWAHMMGPGFVPATERKIVSKIAFPPYTLSDLRPFLARNLNTQGVFDLLNVGSQWPFDYSQTYNALHNNPDPNTLELTAAVYRRTQVCMLDGVGRLNLVMGRPGTPLNKPPQNHIQALFVDDLRRGKLKRATKDAFNFYVLVDPTTPGQFRFCTSPELPEDPDIERSLTDQALAFFSNCQSIESASDGVKAYSGLIAAVLSTDFRVILVDEPEAFLHPPLARKLGVFLTQIVSERSGNVFASTHSADFLGGCIQAGPEVDVIRLTYENQVASARMLESARLRTIMRDPLLRSTGVLSSLFYRGAVVCEADTDRAFYEEINDRVLRFSHGGADGSVFLNAQNWQTCANIIRPLRDMGIPAAAVVDLDVLLSDDLSKLMSAAYVPSITMAGWTQIRARIKSAFERNLQPGEGPRELARLVKTAGITILQGEEREAVERLIADLSTYGVFVVPVGEVERWLSGLSVSGHASRWLIPMFEKLGSDPDAPGYVCPSDEDVWSFIRNIAAWIGNPHRHGIPT